MVIKWQSILVTDLRNGFVERLDDFIGSHPRALALNNEAIDIRHSTHEYCYGCQPSTMLHVADPKRHYIASEQFDRDAVLRRIDRDRGRPYDEVEVDWWGFASAWTRATGCGLDELPEHVLGMMLVEAHTEDWQVDVSLALDRNLEDWCDD